MKLRARLNLVVAGLSAVFVVVLLAAETWSARVAIDQEIGASNTVAAHLLGRLAAIYARDGDTEPLLQFLDDLGRVRANDITLLSTSGEVLYRSPPSPYKAGRSAPAWFAGLLAPDLAAQTFSLPAGARLIVAPDASRAVLDAWDQVVRLATVAAMMLAILYALAFWSVGRALKPFPLIAEGLARIGRGELGYRLPPLPGPEARAIGDAFNGMAQAVEDKVLAERKAREAETRLEERRELGRLVEQRIEEERRMIAHELHDEFSQSVTAIRSLALAISAQAGAGDSQSGSRDLQSRPRDLQSRPRDLQSRSRDLESPQAESQDAQTTETAHLIAAEAARLYDAMHGLIPRLAPLTFDTLGLGETLENLCRDWRRRYPAIELELRYVLDADLGDSVKLVIFRIVQEGIINAVRHAQPSRIDVRVESGIESDRARILVSVADDGVGLPADWARPGRFGLRGLAERVSGLGGTFSVANRTGGGVLLRAEISLMAAMPFAASAGVDGVDRSDDVDGSDQIDEVDSFDAARGADGGSVDRGEVVGVGVGVGVEGGDGDRVGAPVAMRS